MLAQANALTFNPKLPPSVECWCFFDSVCFWVRKELKTEAEGVVGTLIMPEMTTNSMEEIKTKSKLCNKELKTPFPQFFTFFTQNAGNAIKKIRLHT